METQIKVLAFAGSLRVGSYNKALVRAAQQVKPPNVALEIFDLADIPPYNADQENTPPPRVVEFKQKIRDADALLIASPEYNFSIPGVLKNAIDWASRPPTSTPLDGKPVAIMSASTGRFGGARAQYHLRQTFVFLNMHPINRPEVMLSDAANNVDENGNVINQQTRQLIRQLLEALSECTLRMRCNIKKS
jgi:chromate reductase